MEEESVKEIKNFLICALLENQRFLNITNNNINDISEILGDRTLIYRYLKKHKFDMDIVQMAIISHIDWRLNQNIVDLHFGSLRFDSQQLLESGLLRFTNLDHKGRPVAYVLPKVFVPAGTSELEALQNSIILSLECLRRWIFVSDSNNPSNQISQALMVVDLKDFGVSNMVMKANFRIWP